MTDTGADPLSRLHRRPGLPTRIGSRVFAGVREVEADRRPLAEWWEAQNRSALHASGPLWLVLGDSTSQGMGASAPEAGYVPRVLDRLRQHTGDPWRVVNLSITGAKIADVVEWQLAAWAAIDAEADLVTSFVGANDLLYPWGTAGAVRDAERLVADLPFGTLQSRMGGGPPSRPKASAVNDVLRSARDRGHIDLFQPWDWPSMSGAWAADRFHPNDVGYAHLTEAVWKAVEPVLG